MFLVAAISIGLLGSLHCVGMCGPIALALPIANRSFILKITSIILYNLGRALTYSVFGLVFGFLGSGFAFFEQQQFLSIILGILILADVLFSGRFALLFSTSKAISKTMLSVKNKLSVLLQTNSRSSFLMIGMLNGLLPCGMVYLAAAASAGTQNAFKGSFFMFVFGLATIPAMFTVSWFSHIIKSKFRSGINKAVPFMIAFTAVLMILRGLNLGIPIISPKLEIVTNHAANGEGADGTNIVKKKVITCCHKK
jgi:sulfite exporter TauE/SafE